MIWFTADTHFSHNKDFIFKDRGFGSIHDHDETLIRNWNEKISEKDEVYHLGDFAFGNPLKAKYILEQLNGKIYLLRGNHEKTVLNREHVKNRFEWIKDYYELKIDNKLICLMHYPIASWRGRYAAKSIHLHGHSHNKHMLEYGKILDVGVDNPLCNYYPINIEEVFEYMKTRDV